MLFSVPLLILRAILLILSFGGLCSAARERLGLDRFIAPFFCACSILCILMFAGMLRMLKLGFCLMYLGGFACLAQLMRKKRLQGVLAVFNTTNAPALLTGAALLSFLVLRLWPAQLWIPDDLAHWGVVAKHLLAHNALPDASAAAVTFSSYPTGSAAFIYYVCRTLDSFEGLWMIAQNMLMSLMFLPLFAHIRKGARYILPPIFAAFLVLFKFDRPMTTLCVDWLLSFLLIGSVAAILHYRSDLRRTLLIAVPAAIAAVFIKSSGFFFAFCIALAACPAAGTKRGRFFAFALILGAAAAAYLMWTLHISLSYPAALESKHAVSLSAYAQELAQKDAALILEILNGMLLTWLHPSGSQIFTLLGVILSAIMIFAAQRGNDELKLLRRNMLRLIGSAVAAYLLWFIMLFAMYVFSMPESEARILAAYSRYNSTGLLFTLGISLTALLRFYSDEQLQPVCSWQKYACAVLGVLSLAAAPMLSLDMPGFNLQSFYCDLLPTASDVQHYRDFPQSLVAQNGPPEGRDFLICLGTVESKDYISDVYYHSRFELDTANLTLLARPEDSKSWYAKSYYDGSKFSDPARYLAGHAGEFDAILVYRKDTALDGFLKSYSGATPVLYAY